MNKEFKDEIIKALKDRGYQETTVFTYSSRLFKLFSFFPKTPPLEITNEQVSKYAKSLIASKYSNSTIKQLFYACNFFFDDLNGIKHGIYKVKLPPITPKRVTFLTQSEVFRIIDNCNNIKHRCMLLLMYSCGLESGQILDLRVDQVISRDKIPHLRVVNSGTGRIRHALLSTRALPVLRQYFKEYHPTHWFFYGPDSKEKKYSATSLRKVFKKRIEDEELDTSLTTSSLRIAHIKHMSDLGVPTSLVLNNMGYQSYESHLKYSRQFYGKDDVDFTPIDKMIDETVEFESFKDLEQLVIEVQNNDEMDYLLEAVNCLRNGALRAGVIFIWSAGIRNIQNKILLSSTLKEINTELEKIDKAVKTKVKNLDSFEYIKDETTLLLSHRLGIYDKHEKLELTNSCLGLRNKCGHPSNYKPEIQKVKAFVEDMINMVFANKRHLTDDIAHASSEQSDSDE